MSDTFDPEKVQRWDIGWSEMRGCDVMGPYSSGEYVLYSDYCQLKALLHEVSTDADPAGTVRDLAVAKDTIVAQEVLIQELRAEIEKLRGDEK